MRVRGVEVARAGVVVVGGGIVGASVAHHLAELGVDDIIVIDQGDVPENPGSTSHAPGGVVAMSHNRLLARMSFYSTELYRSLDRYDQLRNTYNPVGSVEVARISERMADLVREQGEANAFGAFDTQLLDAEGVAALVPYLDPAEMAGGLLIPSSAIVSGAGISGALLRSAVVSGRASVRSNTTMVDVALDAAGRVSGIVTDAGETIEAERVVLCTNIWSLPVSSGPRIPLPLMAFQHQYVETTDVDLGLDADNPDHEVVYPTVRDMDSAMYYRHHWNRIGIGSYFHDPISVHPDDIGATADRPFTPGHFSDPWESARRLVPGLATVDTFERSFNGMFAFTVDGMPIIGETAIPGLWLSIGAWITHAGGVGKATAELMVGGESEWDLRQATIDRFLPYAVADDYVRVVTAKNYREVYEIHHPNEPPSEPRGVRLSAFAEGLAAFDPHLSPFAGIELASWYGANAGLVGDEASVTSEWAARHWSPIAGAEHRACREAAAVFDLTGLSIIEVAGEDAVSFVQFLCSSQMDVPVGRVVYTTWLTPSGGLKRDLAVTRLAEDRFWMFVGEGTRPADLAWAKKHGVDFDVSIDDISDEHAALGLWGPRAPEILGSVLAADLADFGYFRSRNIEIAGVPVLALRISYVGEAGWELHMPVAGAFAVFDAIWAVARAEGAVLAGAIAMDSLRIEKGYRLWGADIHTEYNPYEAGLGWTVQVDSGPFIGSGACEALVANPPSRSIRCLRLASGDPLGNEAVLVDGQAVGYVTSAAYGHTVGASIAYCYLPTGIGREGSEVEVLIEGRGHPATVVSEPMWDPRGHRLRGDR